MGVSAITTLTRPLEAVQLFDSIEAVQLFDSILVAIQAGCAIRSGPAHQGT